MQTIRENVYAIDEGWGLFATDSASGSGSRGSKKNGGRTYTWNERNQLVSTVDDSRSTSYVYDYNGVRTNKYSRGTETLYFNQFYSVRYDNGVGYGNGQVVKHIYLGDTRIVTKLNSGENPTYQEEYYKQYFYHSDHLGSASMISDYKGDEYQRIEYTPYGETWVEKTQNTGLEHLPYKFTAKEQDEETGLYYFGARYLDAKYSRWLSCDPALGEYIPQVGGDNSSLPGMGGVFNFVNLHLYHYAGNNPINYIDPDGRESGYVIQEDGAGYMSHAGVYTQTEKGYSFFEVTGVPASSKVGKNIMKNGKEGELLSKSPLSLPTVGSANSSNLDTHSGVIRRDFADKDELADFLKGAGYDSYIEFNTTAAQDKAIYNAAQQLGMDFKDYNVLNNNCGQYAVNALSAGGMGINVPLVAVAPSLAVMITGTIALNAMPRALGLALALNHPIKSNVYINSIGSMYSRGRGS